MEYTKQIIIESIRWQSKLLCVNLSRIIAIREIQIKLQPIQAYCVVQHDFVEQAHRRHNSFWLETNNTTWRNMTIQGRMKQQSKRNYGFHLQNEKVCSTTVFWFCFHSKSLLNMKWSYIYSMRTISKWKRLFHLNQSHYLDFFGVDSTILHWLCTLKFLKLTSIEKSYMPLCYISIAW